MAQPIWNTSAGSLGNFISANIFAYQLSASPVSPATSLTYAKTGGSLPDGLTISSLGLISGTTTSVADSATYTFVVRVTDNLGNIADRTFSITLSGNALPVFTTTSGNLATIYDSTWFTYQMEYNNPVTTNPVTVRKISGTFPPGIEINEYGLLRGYAAPPITNVSTGSIVTSIVATTEATNVLSCLSTEDFTVGRPIIFSGTTFGSIIAGTTYYIKSVIDGTDFTISYTVNGSTVPMIDDVGYMTATLPSVTVGQPTNQSYSFTLQLDSPLGSSTQNYSIEVINQNTPVSQGGPGFPPNTRPPAIFNTRPETYNIDTDPMYYGYYLIPPDSEGNTYPPSTPALIGTITSDNVFNFKMLGHDFDGDVLTYNFSSLPLGLTGDTATGWITGTPIIGSNNISQYSFSVYVSKASNPTIRSSTFNFTFKVSNGLSDVVVWTTPANMGTVLNGSTSMSYVSATSQVPLSYRLTNGTLPPNLSLLSTGELSGIIAFEPTNVIEDTGTSTDFTFTIEAYSELYPIISSSRTFTLTVYQEYNTPFDSLYCKCTPSLNDRLLIDSLLSDETLIPTSFLYRVNDSFYGKATNVTYAHAYGIYANDLAAYTLAISERNHYWKNITLGEIKTAIARDQYTGEIIYEVVYSEVIDNLINYNSNAYSNTSQSNKLYPQGVSVSKSIYWPRDIQTATTPGIVRTLYPNSLPNMRQQVVDVLGQETNYNVLPLWMSSQQLNGSTLGMTQAWVIAYCKPGTTELNGQTVSYGNYIKYQIENNWKNEYGEIQTLNTINFKLDRFTVNKSSTYNYNNITDPASWTELPSADPTPDPIDSQDFNVIFPRRTILPEDPV